MRPSIAPLVACLVMTSNFAYAIPYLQHRGIDAVDCLTSFNVPLETSSSANWSALIEPFNLRLSYVPSVVTLPYTPQHVSDSVTCADITGLKVQAKSGGHSYASYSSGGQNGSLIVDMQNFNDISLDNGELIGCPNTARAQSLY
jgi:hypothetical protein